MAYIANTDKDRKDMLEAIGVKDFKDLISNIPDELLLKNDLNLSSPLSELELNKKVLNILSQNKSLNCTNSFLGGGVYDHFVPAAVDHLISRPEFLTTYTPYQAEVSQGTLQWIFEYQSLICELTGMDISNAGMYDGASATAEAILVAFRKTKISNVIISDTINPKYLNVIKTYTEGSGLNITTVPFFKNKLVTDTPSIYVVQTPNYFGFIEDIFALEKQIRQNPKSVLISINDPISLALLNSPAEYNADIVVGEGQSLGNKPYYGGPLFGFIASKLDFSRNLPGRIVGATNDVEGKKSYCLTLQGREQHIRRDKATSNICSNQALCSLAATIYMCLLGKQGLKEVAELCVKNAHYLAKEIKKIPGFSLADDKPFFKEFAVVTPVSPEKIVEMLAPKDIYPGIPVKYTNGDTYLLIAATEKKSKKDMDDFVTELSKIKYP